jgi:hypothetical protein
LAQGGLVASMVRRLSWVKKNISTSSDVIGGVGGDNNQVQVGWSDAGPYQRLPGGRYSQVRRRLIPGHQVVRGTGLLTTFYLGCQGDGVIDNFLS